MRPETIGVLAGIAAAIVAAWLFARADTITTLIRPVAPGDPQGTTGYSFPDEAEAAVRDLCNALLAQNANCPPLGNCGIALPPQCLGVR